MTGVDVSVELLRLFRGVHEVLQDHAELLDAPVNPAGRKSFMDGMGAVNDAYRARVYGGLSGEKEPVGTQEVRDLVDLTLKYLDHSIAGARRPDGHLMVS